MNELIINNNQIAYTTSNQIVYIEKQIAELKAIEDELKAKVMEEMQSKGIRKAENDELAITLVDSTYAERFDSKAFKTAHEELYNEFVKMVDVKASIRIKVKDNAIKES